MLDVIDLRTAPGVTGSAPLHRGGGTCQTVARRVDPSAATTPGNIEQYDPSDPGSADEWADPFEIVIADRSINIVVPPLSGVGLVTAAAVVDAGLTLAVREAGHAVLVEDHIELVPVGLSTATAEDLVELLAATDLPPGPVDRNPLGVAHGRARDGSPSGLGSDQP